MSSSAGASQLYFCHQCNRTVTVSPSPSSSDLSCPNCYGGFIEELDAPSLPSSIPNPSPFDLAPALFLDDLATIFGGGIGTFPRSTSLQDPDAFNPFIFLQNYLQTLRAGGANIQFVIENNDGTAPGAATAGTFRLPANIGDYFIGPGLEQLIQQLAENDPNRYGTPPASKSAVDGLPDIKISEELLVSDSSQCAVCKDSFELNEEAKQMPCKHIYHKDCILPWLELHNSCPVCRYELPTDDPDYEQRRPGSDNGSGNNQTQQLGTIEGFSEAENPPTPRTVERRFRISLPWPFRALASPAEASNSGSGDNDSNNNNNNNNSGNSNSENRENPNFISEPRDEDLD